MIINVFGESLYLVIDVMLGFCKSFAKGSLFFIQTAYAVKLAGAPVYAPV